MTSFPPLDHFLDQIDPNYIPEDIPSIPSIPMKQCFACRKWKPVTEFSNDKRGKYGIDGQCKECKSNRSKGYYKKNKEKIINRVKEYKIKNKDNIKSKQKEYYKENKEKIRKNRKRIKEEAIAIYDGMCQNKRCIETDINTDSRYLEFHHKKGQEAGVKREVGKYTHLIIAKNGIHDDIELLCPPCHKRADIRDGTYISWRN